MKRMDGRFSIAALAVGLAALAAPAPALAGAQIGTTFPDPSSNCGSNVTDLQSGSPGGQYAAPFAGVITSWSYQALAHGKQATSR